MSVDTTPRETRIQRVTRRLVIGLLAPLLLLAILPVSVQVIQKPDLGFSVHQEHVQTVAPGGPGERAGVRRGDRIQALDGHAITDMPTWFATLAGRYDLGPRSLQVGRDGQVLRLTVTPQRPGRPSMIFGLSTWLAGVVFLMIGWWVLARRRDEVARDFCGLCVIFAFFLSDVPDLPSVPYQQLKELAREVLQFLWPVYFLRFFVLFPAPNQLATGTTRRWLFLPAAAFVGLTLGARLLGLDPGSPPVVALQVAAQIYVLGYFLAGLVVFARKVWRRHRPVLQTKLRLILLGLVVGVLPFLAAMAVGGGLLPPFPNWEYLGFSLLLIPLSCGVAIMRYGALDTAFVVRTSLVYGLLTVTVLAAYLATVAVLGTLVTRIYQVSAFPVLVVVIAASSLAVLPLRRRVQGVVDAALYPSRRANREAIAALGRSLAVQVSPAEAHTLLLDRLYQLYRPHSLRLVLAGAADSPVLVDMGRRPTTLPATADIPRDDPLLGYLDRVRRPLFTEEFEDWINAPGGHRQPTLVPLRGTVLLVPLVTGNRLLGVLLWGAKSDDALYSQDDLANLANLALQVAPVLESLRLHEGSLRRRQLETELAVARDIQAQLLPHEPLTVGGAHIGGRNDPCRHVGGDYYDYFALDPRTLAFCIADVAGKGIPAALMMSTVRVTFRELARSGLGPAAVITELDARISAIASPGRFVCFFYGVLDVATGLLTYCNGGHEPPLLFREGGQTEELRRGGPIVGIAAGVAYRSGTVQLRTGDLLLGYTDGITEQTSPDGQEFFEVERLRAMVAGGRDQAPDTVCGRVFAGVAAFGGAEASDDRTVIVLKYNQLND
ncbi:MAG: SpoIIE family protein phosphatase [Candidatus Krumholzibacteriia bacterium]